MNTLCDVCRSKPALTKCRKGSLCKKCGGKCHLNYQHQVQFIIHAPQPQSSLKRSKISKSTVLITKKNIGEIPIRLSKVHSQLKKAKVEISKSINKSSSLSIQKENKAILCNSKIDYLKSVSECGNKSNTETMKQSTVEKSKFQNKNEEQITALKSQVQYQGNLLKLLASKLQKQRNINKKMKLDYEQKLKMIRKLRQ